MRYFDSIFIAFLIIFDYVKIINDWLLWRKKECWSA